MEHLPGENKSFWKASTNAVSYTKLAEDISVDTAVIGGGISGVLAAYYLQKEGKQVALLEAKELAGGTTGGTTAKISSQHQTIYHEMMTRDGKDTAKQYYEANQEGRRMIEELISRHDIKCDFKKMDSYVFSRDGSHRKSLENEADAYEQLGIEGGMTNETPLDFQVDAALVMRGQAEFHPLKFLYGVVKEFVKAGGKVYQHTRYMNFERTDDQLVLLTDTPFTVTCSQVVLATLFPAEDPNSFYSNTLKPATSHLTAFASGQSFDQGMYISDDEPKRTFRGASMDGRQLLIVGGETHPTGNGSSTIEHYQSIKKFAKEEFGLTEMLGYWSEHDLVSPDRRPYIGRIEADDDQMYVMTGYSKWGLAIAPAAARLITDLIIGRENKYEELLSPQRDVPDTDNKEPDSSEKKETPSAISKQAKQLDAGEARRFEADGKPAGMYKDANGQVHYLDLSCTHLGCEVAWNDGDQTWDCPCHGSVFDGKGNVLAGPAKLPLKQIKPFAE